MSVMGRETGTLGSWLVGDNQKEGIRNISIIFFSMQFACNLWDMNIEYRVSKWCVECAAAGRGGR